MAFFQPNPELTPHDSGVSFTDCSVGSPGSATGSHGSHLSHGSPVPENNQSDAGVSLSDPEISKNAEISVSSPVSTGFDLKTETAEFHPTGSSSPIAQPTGVEPQVVSVIEQPEQTEPVNFNHFNHAVNHGQTETAPHLAFHHNFYPDFTAHQVFQQSGYENHSESQPEIAVPPTNEPQTVQLPVQPEETAQRKPEPVNEPPIKRRRTDNRKFSLKKFCLFGVLQKYRIKIEFFFGFSKCSIFNLIH